MTWKIVGTAAMTLALAACGGQSDRATTAAAARSTVPSSASASPTMGGTPMTGGAVNQSATNVSPTMPMAMPMATAPMGTTPMATPPMAHHSDRGMTAAERRRHAREMRQANRGGMGDRDRAYMGGGMVGTPSGSGSMGMAPPASTLGNPSSVGGVGGSNTASTGPGGTTATGSGNQPATGGSSQAR